MDGTAVIASMITWLDGHRLPAWNGKHWRTSYDAGAVTDADVIAAWLESQAAARDSGQLAE